MFYALNQEDFLQAVIGDKQYYKTCKALFVCGSPLASDKGMDGLLESNFAKSQALLKEAGYDGTPIVLLHSTDLQVLTNLAPVAKSLMEKGGFKVDMQSMDWQSVVARRAKKDPPAQGGWNALLTSWVSADILNPVSTAFLNASCDKALVRLAVRRGDGEAARRLRARDRSREAEGDRRGGAGALDAVSDARASRPVVPAGRGAQERRRHRGRAGVGVLEHQQDRRKLSRSAGLSGPRTLMLAYIAQAPRWRRSRSWRSSPCSCSRAAPDAGRSGGDHRGRGRDVAGHRRHPRAGSASTSRSSRSSSSGSGNMFTGDFGESFFFKKKVAELVVDRIEPTLMLATTTMLLSIAVAVPLGVLAAYRQGTGSTAS